VLLEAAPALPTSAQRADERRNRAQRGGVRSIGWLGSATSTASFLWLLSSFNGTPRLVVVSLSRPLPSCGNFQTRATLRFGARHCSLIGVSNPPSNWNREDSQPTCLSFLDIGRCCSWIIEHALLLISPGPMD
jgi:hypothetical protein